MHKNRTASRSNKSSPKIEPTQGTITALPGAALRVVTAAGMALGEPPPQAPLRPGAIAIG